MAKEIFFKENGRNKMKVGIDYVVDAIKTTMGAAGRNVYLWRPFGAPHNTNDGYSIAKEITFIDPVENMGAELVKEVAKKTVDEAGDGTSASSLLLQAIINEGQRQLTGNVNVMNMKRGIDKAVAAVVEKIKSLAQEVDNDDRLLQVATISANNDPEMGKYIVEAVKGVSKDGLITVEENKQYKTEVEFADGMDVDAGFVSPYFMNTPEKSMCVFNEPHILLYGGTLSSFKDFDKYIIEPMVKINHKPLIIIADDFKGDIVLGLLTNIKNGLQTCCIKAPVAEIMEDIASVTGATFINTKTNLKLQDVKISHFGKCETVKITATKTSFIDGYGKEEVIEERIKQLQSQIKNAVSDFDRDNLKQRLAKMQSGVAIIKVGGKTQTEIDEKKDRIDDAKSATIAAMEEGYVAGGGTTFLHCLPALSNLKFDNEDEAKGAKAVEIAIQYPFAQILSNAGLKADDYSVQIVMQPYGNGVNVKTNKVENLLETGVIDPAKVLRCAIENAASAASLFLTTECVVAENI